MAEHYNADILRRQALEAEQAANDIDLMVMIKHAQLEPASTPSLQLPDFSTSEIDPEEVYRFLVEMLGEDSAQEVLLQASADAIEAGMDDAEGRAPTQQDLLALFQNSRQGGEDGSSSDLQGDDGLSDEWAGWTA